MKIDYRSGGIFDANCYVVTFDKEAIVIDPCIDIQSIKKMIGNYHLSFIILTHGHFDHFCSLTALEKEVNVPIYLAKNAVNKLENAFYNCSALVGNDMTVFLDHNLYHYVNDFEKIEIDGHIITFIHTKGHSDCSICILIDNNMFSGDTLFKGSVGRCDLYSGNEAILRKSLANLKQYVLNNYHNKIDIYPGHGDKTNFEEELINNPYLR